MFKRREPLTIIQKAKELVWPSMGLKRAFVYLKYRTLRIADSTPKVALGLALGLGVSFTPLLGTHFLQAGFYAYVLRANIFAAIIGTFIGNPWTFPFFWWAGFSFGRVLYDLLGLEGGHLPEDLNPSIIWDVLMTEPLDILMPWMLGGYTLMLVLTPLSYFVFYQMVHLAKLARSRAINRKQRK